MFFILLSLLFFIHIILQTLSEVDTILLIQIYTLQREGHPHLFWGSVDTNSQ